MLEGRITVWGGGRWRKNNFNCWFTLQWYTMARAGLDRSWEPRASSESAICVQVPKHLRHLQLLSHTHEQRAGSEVEQRGLKPMPILDDRFLGSGFSCYTIMPIPSLRFFLRKVFEAIFKDIEESCLRRWGGKICLQGNRAPCSVSMAVSPIRELAHSKW